MANRIVDARGEQNPIPVVKAMKALERMSAPGALEVHVDDETAARGVLSMADEMSYAAKSERLEDGHFLVTVAVSPTDAATGAEVDGASNLRGDTVAVIGTATMGNGNGELGRTLMKAFLYTLSQMEELPKTVMFYNGGAYLTTEGSASIEDLKHMESQGVEILTCGICLDYYGLRDKLQVGGVMNMYVYLEKLMNAGKIIRP